jgi:hypothetical protein
LSRQEKGNFWDLEIKKISEKFKFKYTGVFHAPVRSLKATKLDSSTVKVRVYFWNLQFPSEDGNKYYIGLDSAELLAGSDIYPVQGNFSYPSEVSNSHWYPGLSSKAYIFKKRLVKATQDSISSARAAAMARENHNRAVRIKNRKKVTRLISGAMFTFTGGVLGYMSQQATSQGDKYYKEYKAALYNQPVDAARHKVEKEDNKAQTFGILSAVSFGISIFIFSF